MALAFLASSITKYYHRLDVADNPINSIQGLVVDHRLREESYAEAKAVTEQLSKLGIHPFLKSLDWKKERRAGIDPAQLRNIETLAREKRYQTIGRFALMVEASSVFFAHHRDDQYETVMMRLLSGHGYRGLQGIRNANAIPECYDLHGVYKSGLIDDQLAKSPFLSFKPSNKTTRRLRHVLRTDTTADPWAQIKSFLDISEAATQFPGHMNREPDPRVPYLTPLNCEDGGVTIYRPLLEFDKDRLRATCEANNVKWFEDRTNHDATLTTRNAVRHLVRSYELPRALQKPAVLAMADRARRRVRLEEAEAHRLLIREAVIKDFDPNAGTMLIEPPRFSPRHGRRRRPFEDAREQARIAHRRLIASIAIRTIINFVTPDRHLPPLANLQNVVDWLFPELSLQPEASPPKAFGIAGVVFESVQGHSSTQWFLSRMPYTSNQPVPRRVSHSHGIWRPKSLEADPDEPAVVHRKQPKTIIFHLWDGRFWLRLTTRVVAQFSIQPLTAEHLGAFRRALPPARRRRLEALLKYYAPGKVRYSLPALYNEEAEWPSPDAPGRLTLLALPSLGIHVPGLERWVKYDVRYKKIDGSLLGHTKRGAKRSWLWYRSSLGLSRQRRWRRLMRHRNGS